MASHGGDKHKTVFPVPKAQRPLRKSNYAQRERPLSYQPRFTPVEHQPLNNYGFPEPGIQSPSARQVIAKDYLVSDETWEDICNHSQDIDFIVIGSGFTALAFIEETLKRDPNKKILCLERGDFWLPDHFQNLPIPFKFTLGGPSETFPFTLSKKTYTSEVKFVHGSCPFFGGRSTFWSAWSPSPHRDLLRGWPESLITTTEKPEFFAKATKLLRVTSASKIGEPYGKLQTQIDERLQKGVKDQKIPSADQGGTYPAPMAVSSIAQTSTIHFTKFSTPGPLLGLYKRQQKLAAKNQGAPLLFVTNTAVEYLVTEVGFPPPQPNLTGDESVKFVRSSRHTDLPVRPNHTKIILAAGAFPSTTLVLNSFQHVAQAITGAGRTVTGHFLTHLVGRVKRSAFADLRPKALEIGAEYLSGKHPTSGLQYHIQVTAMASPDPEQDAEDAARFCPDYAAAASDEQLRESRDWVIFVCATLGELSEDNPESFFRLNPSPGGKDPTANCVLQVTLDKKDLELWDQMDEATFQAIEVMSGGNPSAIQWWHDPKGAKKKGYWAHARPGEDTIRMEGIVHEASLMPLGNEKECPVDENYKLKGVSNVYVTGAAIFPTSGSWNPTLTMCGFAQDLAAKLTPEHHTHK
ncbi:FAD/NAD(P)-binding domain-containing protein [Ceratobasidium sp. AG-I]|nr:FAD/NAD(P)-binding domain-containing protein [Ceratobasidium sp. AG-I]